MEQYTHLGQEEGHVGQGAGARQERVLHGAHHKHHGLAAARSREAGLGADGSVDKRGMLESARHMRHDLAAAGTVTTGAKRQ